MIRRLAARGESPLMKACEDVDPGSEGERDDGRDDEDDGLRPFVFFVLLEAGLAPTSLLIGWCFGYSPLNNFSWSGNAIVAGIAAALPMLIFLAVTLRWPIGPMARIRTFFDRELAPLLKECRWSDYLLISVAAGVGEEMLFRGLIQGGLSLFFGPWAGASAAAVLFGLMHPVSMTYVVVATLLGAYLGVVWLVTGNLLSVMVAHGIYDFLALLILMSYPSSTAENEP